jgi:hypothetical protein
MQLNRDLDVDSGTQPRLLEELHGSGAGLDQAIGRIKEVEDKASFYSWTSQKNPGFHSLIIYIFQWCTHAHNKTTKQTLHFWLGGIGQGS